MKFVMPPGAYPYEWEPIARLGTVEQAEQWLDRPPVVEGPPLDTCSMEQGEDGSVLILHARP